MTKSATAKLFWKDMVKRLRSLATHIPKTIDDLNLNFMKNIFTLKSNARLRSNYIFVKEMLYKRLNLSNEHYYEELLT